MCPINYGKEVPGCAIYIYPIDSHLFSSPPLCGQPFATNLRHFPPLVSPYHPMAPSWPKAFRCLGKDPHCASSCGTSPFLHLTQLLGALWCGFSGGSWNRTGYAPRKSEVEVLQENHRIIWKNTRNPHESPINWMFKGKIIQLNWGFQQAMLDYLRVTTPRSRWCFRRPCAHWQPVVRPQQDMHFLALFCFWTAGLFSFTECPIHPTDEVPPTSFF